MSSTDPSADSFLNFQQWLEWLEQRNPVHIELGLDRVRAVWQVLRTQNDIQVPTLITVAGTNGKGSSCALLDAILQAAGYRVGRYTSPHLSQFNERILVNGRPVDDATLCEGMRQIHACAGSERLTYFEWATLLAFWSFFQEACTVWVLEVGMGGRLDAVNVLDADLALITPIGLDHQAFLGETREAIGREKAGILRQNQIAVYADPAPVASIVAMAEELGCQLLVRQRDFTVAPETEGWQLRQQEHITHWPNPALFGKSQIDNAAGVVTLLLNASSRLTVAPEAIAQGLRAVQLPGRFERCVQAGRHILLDVAHNEESAQALRQNLDALFAIEPPKGKIRAVFSALADKPITAMLRILAHQFDDWYIAPLEGARAANLSQLQQAGTVLRTSDIHYEDTIVNAYNRAFNESRAGDYLVIFGSFHTVGALRALACEHR
ncbi:bifunctional folylpolyglutamate synthase/dihydrofolate synthase [Halothiobacillus sp. DCM-1]|uniref:bifunctional folylpolyglutamate synthase/dihydrofolate synthase n=1 Tax=Halothiobacillus sp. DCM-1 TaxID=3112558 RepID=UPI00324E2783